MAHITTWWMDDMRAGTACWQQDFRLGAVPWSLPRTREDWGTLGKYARSSPFRCLLEVCRAVREHLHGFIANMSQLLCGACFILTTWGQNKCPRKVKNMPSCGRTSETRRAKKATAFTPKRWVWLGRVELLSWWEVGNLWPMIQIQSEEPLDLACGVGASSLLCHGWAVGRHGSGFALKRGQSAPPLDNVANPWLSSSKSERAGIKGFDRRVMPLSPSEGVLLFSARGSTRPQTYRDLGFVHCLPLIISQACLL